MRGEGKKEQGGKGDRKRKGRRKGIDKDWEGRRRKKKKRRNK